MAAGFASAQLQADRGHIFSKILYLTFFKAKMADFPHVVLLPQAGELLDWGGSGGQKIDTGGSASLRRKILPKDF